MSPRYACAQSDTFLPIVFPGSAGANDALRYYVKDKQAQNSNNMFKTLANVFTFSFLI